LNCHLPLMGTVCFGAAGDNGSDYEQVCQMASEPSEYQGQWNHWVFTKDLDEDMGRGVTGSQRMYLNGQLWAEWSDFDAEVFVDAGAYGLGFGAGISGIGPYYGLIDDFRIYNHSLDANEVYDLYAFGSALAGYPNPVDKATYVASDAVLSWRTGFYAADVNGHDVYLGTDFNDVNDANTTVYNPNDVYIGRQDVNEFAPVLEFETKYYWRIDEVNEAHPEKLWKGEVWSFTVEPFSQLLTVCAQPNDVGIDTITPEVGEHYYYRDTIVDVNAAEFANCEVDPNVYHFDRWEGGVADVNSAQTAVTMDVDRTITAVFEARRECGDQCHPVLQGDINGDCYIDFVDFALYCDNWLGCTHPDCD